MLAQLARLARLAQLAAGEPGVASMDIPVKFHYFEVTKMTI